jgi:hypothetical protein
MPYAPKWEQQEKEDRETDRERRKSFVPKISAK